jgi:hypothetical protein
MNCAYDKEKLTGYYDGELGAAEKAEVERHIASCSECLRDLGELKSAALLVKELPRLRAPVSIAAGVSREIQAAGKLHVLAKFRRTVLWASAAAAGLFIVMNVMYFKASKPEAAMALKAQPVQPIASTGVVKQEAPDPAANAAPQSRRPFEDGQRQEDLRRAQESDRKDAVPAAEEQKLAARSVDALKKADDKPEKPREKAAAEEPKAPAAALPTAPAAPPSPKPGAAPMPAEPKGEAAKPVVAQKERELEKVEPGFAPKVDPSAKAKSAAAEAPADLAPIHCTLSTTQLAKARPRMEDALKKLGVALPPAQPNIKGPRPLPENVLTIEISDSQLAALREELEKAGDVKLMQSYPVEPVLPQFRGGGLFAKKETQSGGAAAAGKAKPDAKDKDGKDAPALDAAAAAEPRRKVTLHLVEVKTLPADADDRPLKK